MSKHKLFLVGYQTNNERLVPFYESLGFNCKEMTRYADIKYTGKTFKITSELIDDKLGAYVFVEANGVSDLANIAEAVKAVDDTDWKYGVVVYENGDLVLYNGYME